MVCGYLLSTQLQFNYSHTRVWVLLLFCMWRVSFPLVNIPHGVDANVLSICIIVRVFVVLYICEFYFL